ncbi:hypothetical protein BGZ75_006279 [Mortierella antarctica]|nr:hypothetical protein BGZ75_006279 [Mortierella antarctica]
MDADFEAQLASIGQVANQKDRIKCFRQSRRTSVARRICHSQLNFRALTMDYFAQFPEFSIRQGEHLRNAFKRLARSRGWQDGGRSRERAQFHRQVMHDMNAQFAKLEHLQDLCRRLFDQEPGTITQCQKLLCTKFINIWDIVERDYKYFDSFKDFRKYTTNGRTFDREAAKGLRLNVFLRKL